MNQNILRKLMLIVVLLTSLHAFAHDLEVDGIYYKITSTSDRTVTVTYKGNYNYTYSNEYTGSVVIPTSVTYNSKTYSVTSIGDYAFNDCSGLTSVTIPNSVTSIGNDAFSDCSGLTSVTIPNSVTSIGDYAFSDCSGLTSVTIGNSVTSIGNYAFRNCSGLTSVTIPNSVTTIGDYAFESCSGLRSITIGSSVTSISSSVFSGCYIKKAIWVTNTPPQGYANLSSAVHYVANEQYTSLSNVTIYPYLSSMFEVDGIKYVPVSPSNRTCDAIDCTYDTNAVNVNIGNKVTYKGVEMSVTSIQPYACYDNANINELKINFNGNIHEYAFNKCSAIKNVEIKVVEIGSYTFSNCSAIEHLTVHAEDIGNSCFSQSATKESAIFEISAKTIGDNSFKGCTKVESITLSDDLTSIGKNAFENCSNLKEIEIQNMVTSLGENSFSGCTSLENVTIGNGVTKIYGSAFSGCSKLPKITIPSNVKTIGDNVFNNCTSLATVVINDRDTELSLGSNSSNPLFYYCPLDSVYIGGDITYPTSSSKGYSPFYRNTKLRSVVITDKETEISDNEFYGCSNLKNISMGDGIEKIGNWAFSGCSSLEHFAFGSGMKTIGEEAFSDCTAMTKLISRTTTPPTCGTQALDDINKWTCELFVPQSAVSAYQGANQWKEFFFIIGTESSGVESTFADDVNVSVENGNIVINGADNAKVEVYSVNGHCVYSGNVTIIPITAKGLYIVKVNGKSYKVIL